jgi:hypothetical protein
VRQGGRRGRGKFGGGAEKKRRKKVKEFKQNCSKTYRNERSRLREVKKKRRKKRGSEATNNASEFSSLLFSFLLKE